MIHMVNRLKTRIITLQHGHLTDHLAAVGTANSLILKEVTMAHQAGPQVNITPIPHDPLHILPLLDLCSSILKEEAIAEVIEVAAFGAALLATEVEVVLKIPTGTKALPNGGIMTTWATEGSVTWTSPAPWTSIAWMMEMNLIKLMIEMLKMGQTVWPPLTDHPQRVRARNRSRGGPVANLVLRSSHLQNLPSQHQSPKYLKN